jgi:hypothetical protein
MMALMAAQQKEYAGDKSGIAPDDNYRSRSRRGSALGRFFGGGGTSDVSFDLEVE